MQIKTFVLGELTTNTYLLINELTSQAIIIDPADNDETLNDVLLQENLQLAGVLLTHGHFDHVLGLLSLKSAWQMPIYLHSADNFLIETAQKSAEHWLGHVVDPVPKADLPLIADLELNLAGLPCQVVATPGHTPGSVGFLFPQDKIYFSGDTLFKDGVGDWRHAYSSKNELKKSLAKIDRLREQGKIAEIYPGHGEMFF